MLQLVIFWVILGVLFGVLAQAARLGFSARGLPGRNGWLATLAAGAALSLLGGLLGTRLLGRLYGTPTALWVGILGVVLAPWLWARFRRSRDAAKPAE
jgi:uncharacterized membrane protein YeaQ/YmgE (transglycosylase-associated protein family)